MSLKERINVDFMDAFKSKQMDKKNFLGVVKGEIQNEVGRSGKDDDETVINILKKIEKSLKQTNTEESLKELEYIKPYLPTMMGEDQIRDILLTYKSNGINNVGLMMGEFNKNYKGLADNKLVSEITKEILKN
jgi:uncharacterized protein YqeY